MGFFSWNTSDTNKSIANCHSSRPVFTVHMITEDGQVFTEKNYDGYGVFGEKDYYVLMAELNGITGSDEDQLRSKAIDLAFSGNPCKRPKLVEKLPSKENWQNEWNKLPESEECDFQGYFYIDEETCPNCGIELDDSGYCTGCDENF